MGSRMMQVLITFRVHCHGRRRDRRKWVSVQNTPGMVAETRNSGVDFAMCTWFGGGANREIGVPGLFPFRVAPSGGRSIRRCRPGVEQRSASNQISSLKARRRSCGYERTLGKQIVRRQSLRKCVHERPRNGLYRPSSGAGGRAFTFASPAQEPNTCLISA